jgi:tetratricopeptide (TPR) repeat protein
MAVSSIGSMAEAFFADLDLRQAQRSALAQGALSSGADLALKADYAGAAREFKRSIGLDPSPANATQAYDLLANVCLQQNQPEEAIKAYKASISLVPADANAHANLANIYFGQQRYSDAENEYSAAVRIDPTSSTNIYSLGQVYLATGRYQEAQARFLQVARMEPNHYGSHYALGQTYSRAGRPRDAVAEFQTTIGLKRDFYQARVDLGSAYADLGQRDNANEQLKVLKENAPDLADLLRGYIDKATPPKILAAYNTSGFVDTLGPGTKVSELDPALSAAGAAQEFFMSFIFSKNMDASSVQNPFNWAVKPAPMGSPSGAYNWGMPTPPTEVQVSPVPISVVYSPDSLTAKVFFLVKQNGAATGTIDPSHLMFKFRGKDANCLAMDTSADEYSGLSRIV